jgi:hypothetical protein
VLLVSLLVLDRLVQVSVSFMFRVSSVNAKESRDDINKRDRGRTEFPPHIPSSPTGIISLTD